MYSSGLLRSWTRERARRDLDAAFLRTKKVHVGNGTKDKTQDAQQQHGALLLFWKRPAGCPCVHAETAGGPRPTEQGYLPLEELAAPNLCPEAHGIGRVLAFIEKLGV